MEQNNIKELVKFCESHKRVYLYRLDAGAGYIDYIAKFLTICSVQFDGIVDSCGLKELAATAPPEETGIVITAYDFLLNAAYEQIREEGYGNLFFLTEWYKNSIPEKLRPRVPERFFLEISLADHCNLNCRMCDHFSPLVKEHFLDFNGYAKDMGRMAEISGNNVGVIKLLGGEPLLHPELPSFLVLARALFPSAMILLYTNGLLLPRWDTEKVNLWRLCALVNVRIMVTTYPVGFDYTKLDMLAKKYQTPYSRFVEESDNVIDRNEVLYNGTVGKRKQLVRHPLNLDKKVPSYEFIDCYHFNKCITLREGKLYPCPVIPHSKYFSAYFGQDLKIDKGDYIDIYSAKSFSEISEFLSKRVPFCGYCAVSRREGGMEFKQSKMDMDEWL